MFVETGTRAGGSARVDAELGSAPTEWIEREVGELAAHIAAAMARWLELVAELDRRSAHEAWGFHSCGAWLAWRCGVDPRSAREHVRIARALSDLPLVAEQFGQGLLSYSKVRAITRIAEPSNEAELVEMARFATAAQLERIVRGCRRAVSLESAEAAHRDRFLAWEWDEDGSLLLRGRLSPEDGASFVKAIEAGEEEIRDREVATGGGSQGGSAEPGARRADALMEVADVSLAGGTAERRRSDRHQVVVHAEAASLATEREVSGCALQDGPALCNETARRIACDASLVRVTHGPAGALDIGRKSRTVPAAMRRALDLRDGGRCSFPGCENSRWVDAHHIVHWARGGHTKLDNLILLCTHHHRLVHEGGFSVTRSARGKIRFRRPGGFEVPPLPHPERGSCRKLRRRNREAGLRIGPQDSASLGRGEAFDRELAVGGLLARAGPP